MNKGSQVVNFSVVFFSFLKPVKMEDGEAIAEFLERVRLAIALHLKITPTKFTAADKVSIFHRTDFCGCVSLFRMQFYLFFAIIIVPSMTSGDFLHFFYILLVLYSLFAAYVCRRARFS